MKKVILIFFVSLLMLTCSKSTSNPETKSKADTQCGTHTSGQQLYKGPEGGCFYYNTNGYKTYVDKAECKC